MDGLTQFVDTLVPTPEPVSDTPMEELKERNLQLRLPASVDVQRRIVGPGCSITGFVLVKKFRDTCGSARRLPITHSTANR